MHDLTFALENIFTSAKRTFQNDDFKKFFGRYKQEVSDSSDYIKSHLLTTDDRKRFCGTFVESDLRVD